MKKINARSIHEVNDVQDYATHLKEFGMYSELETIKKKQAEVDRIMNLLSDARDDLQFARTILYQRVMFNWTDKEIDKARAARAKEVNEAE